MVNNPSVTAPDNEQQRGRLFILLAAILWSLAGVFIKFLDLHPLAIVLYRSLFASLVFVPFLRIGDFRLNGTLVVSALTYTAAIASFVSANKLTTAANAIVLQYTAPVFVFVFARLVLGEKTSRLNILALSVSMLGVAVISFDSAGEPEMAGVLLALLSGVLFAVYMVNLARIKDASPVYVTWFNNLTCAAVLLPFISAQLSLTAPQAVALAVMGAVQLGLPYFLFFKGLQRISVQEAALLALIEPVLNPVWVASLVGEIPSPATLTGGAMILLALALRYLWPLIGGLRR